MEDSCWFEDDPSSLGGGVVCAPVCGGVCATVVPVFRGLAFALRFAASRWTLLLL
ncbi:hypothetical protein U1Q18_033568 [Sarracenia purpurea var. burkii]